MTETYRFAVLGDPVDHSRSPAIHQEALRLADLTGEYLAIRADKRKLIASVEEMRAGQFDGLNITMPLKELAANLCQLPGALNTLRFRDNEVQGISTDTVVLKELLSSEGFREKANILILGSGGSALSAMAAIESQNVYISGRNDERVSAVAADREGVSVVPWGTGVAGAVVVNCTPIGMASDALPDLVVGAGGALVDLPYGPPRTPAVMAALNSGIPVVDGYEFLARQAAASFEWWTGIGVDFKPLADVARNV